MWSHTTEEVDMTKEIKWKQDIPVATPLFHWPLLYSTGYSSIPLVIPLFHWPLFYSTGHSSIPLGEGLCRWEVLSVRGNVCTPYAHGHSSIPLATPLFYWPLLYSTGQSPDATLLSTWSLLTKPALILYITCHHLPSLAFFLSVSVSDRGHMWLDKNRATREWPVPLCARYDLWAGSGTLWHLSRVDRS